MKDLVLKPRISEKAYKMVQDGNVYTFNVPLSANKLSIANAVEAQFAVTVEGVTTVVSKGKTVRSYRKRSRAVTGKRADTKKAYVTLKSGDSIAVFETEEEPKADAKKPATKKADKKETK